MKQFITLILMLSSLISFSQTEKQEDILNENNEAPFAKIEEVPIYPGCENASSNKEKKACMVEMIKLFVLKKFDSRLFKKYGVKRINRLYTRFKIDEDGNVVDIAARGDHPRLEKEALRVLEKLPKMKPGKVNGQPVGVLYALPIMFKN